MTFFIGLTIVVATLHIVFLLAEIVMSALTLVGRSLDHHDRATFEFSKGLVTLISLSLGVAHLLLLLSHS